MFKKLAFILCLSVNINAHTFMNDWSDIAEYSFENLSPNIINPTQNAINRDTFTINLVKQNKNNFIIAFTLDRVVNGGVFLDSYYSDGRDEYCDEDYPCPDKLLVTLTPINSTKAIISFDKIPSCTLEAFKNTSNTLIIKGLESSNCKPLKQIDEYYGDSYKVSFINENYYKIKAGFDCTKARTKAENIICQNKDLALLDREVNDRVYEGIRKRQEE